MAADLFPGRKVRCVDANFNPLLYPDGEVPVLNEVYIIRAVITDFEGWPVLDTNGTDLLLEGVVNPIVPGTNFEQSFGSQHFSPIDDRETDITVFERLLVAAPRELEPAP